MRLICAEVCAHSHAHVSGCVTICVHVCALLTLKCSKGLNGQHPPPDGREAPAQAAGGREEHLLFTQRYDALQTRV